jgi:cytochrome c oxidase subunit 4
VILLSLFFHDRPTRFARDYRDRPPRGHRIPGLARHIYAGILYSGRDRWLVLAFRRLSLDFPFPVVLLDRAPPALGNKMSEHIVTKKQYSLVFGMLLVLTLTTTWVSYIDLGKLNVVVALVIAVVKSMLVVLFFMHVYWSTKLNKLVVVAGLAWLCLLLWLTLTDIFTRGWLPFPGK